MEDVASGPDTPTRPGAKAALSRVVLGVLNATLRFSPVPTTLVIRKAFTVDGARVSARLQAAAPAGVDVMIDQPYGPSPDERVDIYRPSPQPNDAKLPCVIWIHGGAWLAGDKRELDGYLRMIAAEGFVVVAPNYSLAPRYRYPVALHQLASAIATTVSRAPEFGIDPQRVALAGDSAGAQLSAQLATVATNPIYATQIGLDAPLPPQALKAVVLCCGVYDLDGFPAKGEFATFTTAVGWSYMGRRDFRDAEDLLHELSPTRHATAAFPSTFITAGNSDPLESQSRALATHLRSRAVDVAERFFPADHDPALGHEYQFHLEFADAVTTRDQIIAFLHRTMN